MNKKTIIKIDKKPTNTDREKQTTKDIVLQILQSGVYPNQDTIMQQLKQNNIRSSAAKKIQQNITNIFPKELSDDDIKLLSNMYEDIGTQTYTHSEFSINFNNTHEMLLSSPLDEITKLLDSQTVSQLTLGTQNDLFRNLDQPSTNTFKKAT